MELWRSNNFILFVFSVIDRWFLVGSEKNFLFTSFCVVYQCLSERFFLRFHLNVFVWWELFLHFYMREGENYYETTCIVTWLLRIGRWMMDMIMMMMLMLWMVEGENGALIFVGKMDKNVIFFFVMDDFIVISI